jgi:cytochrome c-type biogenesis protein CcmF
LNPVTFFLTIFGTFMTRSGVVQSIHAFGADPVLARLFTIFMLVILTFSFGLVVYRLPLLRARNELDSWMSREAAFLANNWILLFSALFVLFATMFPTLSEAITGHRLTIATVFYARWMAPVGIILLFLTGIGPLLAWRKSTLTNLRRQFLWPVTSTALTGTLLAMLGLSVWPSGLCFALCAFVTGTIVQEFWRGGLVRRQHTDTDLFTAIIGLVGRNRRRYGGYIVHLGIVLMFVGFAGNAYKQDTQVQLKLGDQVTIGRYTLRNDAVKVSDDGQKQMATAHISVFDKGKPIDELYPARWYFRKHEQEPTTEVAIRRSLTEDLYVVFAFDKATLGSQSATLQIVINPLVNWIWLGFGLLALGTGIALLPEGGYSFALAKLGTRAATTATAETTAALTLAVAVFAGTTAYAQHIGGSASVQNSFYARNPLEKQLQHEIVCTCGSCGHAGIGECRKDPCVVSDKMRGELAAWIDQGKSHDEIIQAFVTRYGSEEMLGAPIDKGFSRLAWLFPYLIGVTGAFGVGVVAVRWSHQRPAETPDMSSADPGLEERLDDELRDLDCPTVGPSAS